MARYSLWGQVDQKYDFCRGMFWVGTSSHGGLTISQGFARKHLSPAAYNRGQQYGGYVCYEEDCAYAIAFFDLLHFHPSEFAPILLKGFTAMQGGTLKEGYSLDKEMQGCLRCCSAWNADYLLEIGVTPMPEQYAQWQKDKLDDKMRQEKNPDLIVSAIAAGDDLVKVTTADDKEHLVTAPSYDKHYHETNVLNLLSKCAVVTSVTPELKEVLI